jgi:hypothetical protein
VREWETRLDWLEGILDAPALLAGLAADYQLVSAYHDNNYLPLTKAFPKRQNRPYHRRQRRPGAR